MKLPRFEQPWCTKNTLKPGEIDEREIPAPPIEPGEKEGKLKWNGKREFILRMQESGDLKYVPTLKPGITSAMAFGFRRGKKRRLFMYKGHLCPYLRVDPRSPLSKLIIPEDQLSVQKSTEMLIEYMKEHWPVNRKRPKVSWEQLAVMVRKGEIDFEEPRDVIRKRRRRK